MVLSLKESYGPMDRIESPQMNPHMYDQLIWIKLPQTQRQGKDSFINKWCWKNWMLTSKKNTIVSLYTKSNSKWIKDLNIRPETVKL